MYFILLFFLSWAWFLFKADKSRAKELFEAAVFSCFLGSITDLIMVEYKLWAYSGLPQSLYTIPILLDLSVYPVVSYLFIQNLSEHWGGIFKRTLLWSIGAIFFEWITFITDHIEHLMWWKFWMSFLADILIFLSLAAFYRFYSPAYRR